MKHIFAAVLMLVMTGCNVAVDLGASEPARVEYPTVNLPRSLRQENWLGSKGEGSCVFATAVSLFRWQGRYWMADRIRTRYGNGEYADDSWNPQSNLADKLDAEGVRYAYTTAGDVSFLEWACSTRRGCGVTVLGGRHMVALYAANPFFERVKKS